MEKSGSSRFCVLFFNFPSQFVPSYDQFEETIFLEDHI